MSDAVDYLTPQQVAERCQVSYKTVLGAIHRGELEAYEIAKRLRVPIDAYEGWARAHPARRAATVAARRPLGAGSRRRRRAGPGSDDALLAIEREATMGG